MQIAITGAFPIFFSVSDLRHRLITDSMKALFTLFCNFAFDRSGSN